MSLHGAAPSLAASEFREFFWLGPAMRVAIPTRAGC